MFIITYVCSQGIRDSECMNTGKVDLSDKPLDSTFLPFSFVIRRQVTILTLPYSSDPLGATFRVRT